MKDFVLVTGGCGFIGTNTCEVFIEKGYNVLAFDNLSRKGVQSNLDYLRSTYPENFEFLWGDIRNVLDLDRIPQGCIGIVHLASNPGIPRSMQQPKYDFEVNALGTLNVLEFARHNGRVPVIFASTNKVYSDMVNEVALVERRTRYEFATGLFDRIFCEGASDLGFSETFAIDGEGRHPHSPYGCSKYAGDIYCQEYSHCYGVPTVVNRMSCIYGQHQHGVCDQGWVSWFCAAKALDRDLVVYGDGKQVRDCLYGRDLAELYELELRDINIHGGRVYNVGGGMENTVSLLETIDYLNKKPGYKMQFTKEEWRLADHKVYISDITKVSRYWTPKTKIWEGLDKTYEWVEKNKHLWL